MQAAAKFRDEYSAEIRGLPEANRQVGRWDLRFELATGGMATVYLAYAPGEEGVGKLAAVKLIHPHLARESDYVAMFMDEARLASLIQHPNVCGVFEFGKADNVYFIAMEYLLGEPLAQLQRALIHRGAPERQQDVPFLAARLIADAAEGLHAAHELHDPATGEALNLVHRDVSPQNVFVTYDGAVRIVDFGVALAKNRLHQTRTGTVKGKFAYMSPEQMRGRGVDRRADVWSLGVLLWETVALQRLFRRDNDAETVYAVSQGSIPRPSEVGVSVLPELEAIIMRALERDADARYQSARAMAHDLETFLLKRPTPLGIAEVSEWMHELFPRRMARREQLLQLATQKRGAVSMLGGQEDWDSGASLASVQLPSSGARPAPAPRRRGFRVSLMAGFAVGLVALGMWLGRPVERNEARAIPDAAAGHPTPDVHRAEATPAPPADRSLAAINQLRTHAPTTAEADSSRDGEGSRYQTPINRVHGEHSLAAINQLRTHAPTTAEADSSRGGEGSRYQTPIERAHGEHARSATKNHTTSAEPLRAQPAPQKRTSIARARTQRGRRRAGRPRRGQGRARRLNSDPPSNSTEPSTNTRANATAPPGRVAIATLGTWASVYEGRRRLGQTPGTFELPAGRHRLSFRPLGGEETKKVWVTIRPNTTQRLRVDLRSSVRSAP